MSRRTGFAIVLALVVVVDLALGSSVDPVISWVRTDLFDMLNPSPVARNQPYEYGLKKGFETRVRFGNTNFPVITDQHGFRFDRTQRDSAKTPSRNWLILGDSFTFGSGVSHGETFAGRIEQGRPQVNVMNAAVESYSPANYLAKTVHLLRDGFVSADEVIVFIDISDPFDEVSRRVSSAGKVVATAAAGTADAPGMRRRPRPQSKAFKGVRQWLREHSLIVRSAYEVKDFFFPPPPRLRRFDPNILYEKGMWTADAGLMDRYANDGLARAAEHLTRLAGFLKTKDADLTIVVYPWPHQILVGDVEPLQVTYWRRWAACNGARFIDLFPPFFDDQSPEDTIDRYFLAGDVHWNARGHQLIADKFLRRRDAAAPKRPAGRC